jgi:hypothetical protein
MVAASSESERKELVKKVVPAGDRVVVTVEQEDGARGRQIVRVWRESKETVASPP